MASNNASNAHTHLNVNANVYDDVPELLNTLPPPPYPGNNPIPANASYDLSPTPHSQNRPRLPLNNRNPHLQNLPEDITVVKFQTIVREAKEIVVGRIKVPIPGNNAHAFILRRYDTNAISLTTMFKVAFPGASEEDERREMDWVKSSFDMRDTNGGRGLDAVRLAGQWYALGSRSSTDRRVSRHLALHLAPAYHVTDLVTALARAVPDPNVAYRKSQRSQAAAEQLQRARVPPPSDAASPALKRQRGQDDTRQFTLEATTTITSPTGAAVNVEEEIEKSKRLVQELKRDMQASAAAGEDVEIIAESSRGRKRGSGEETEVIVSEGNVNERLIKSSKRVQRAEGTAQKVLWGAVIFGLGVGATFLPQLTGLL